MMDLRHFWRRAISRVARETLFREMSDSAAAQILTCTAKVLDDMKVDWWLTDGTLLGFVRDKGFIPHDADVDVGVSAKDYTPALERRLAAAGLEVYACYGKPDNGYEITLRSRWLYLPGTSLDLIFYYEDGDSVWNACYYKGQQLRYRYPRFDTVEVEVRGFRYRMPADPGSYLETKYGSGWKHPDPNWHNLLSPESLEVDRLPPVARAAHAALARHDRYG